VRWLSAVVVLAGLTCTVGADPLARWVRRRGAGWHVTARPATARLLGLLVVLMGFLLALG